MSFSVIIYSLVSVIIDSLLSLLGVFFLVLHRRTFDELITYTLALSSGILLGTAFLDLIPEGLTRIGNDSFLYVIAGMISFFALEKVIAWHHHADEDIDEKKQKEKPFAYLTLVGDGIHNFIDGVIIGISYVVSIPLGITTTIAIIAHEIPHELSDFTLLIYGGFSNKKALWWNFLSGLTSIFGTVLVLLLSKQIVSISGFLLPFAAGNFLYIAASDLIPELHKKGQVVTSVFQILLIILGVSIISLLIQYVR